MENGHILVVDDDYVTLRTLERILVVAGYSVIPLSLGGEAIKIAKDRSPGLIILDIMMPDMDGGDVASSLVTKKEEQSSSKKHGIYFMSKPFERDELLNKIRNALL